MRMSGEFVTQESGKPDVGPRGRVARIEQGRSLRPVAVSIGKIAASARPAQALLATGFDLSHRGHPSAARAAVRHC